MAPDASSSLAERVQEISWYHRMALPGGIVTSGVSDTSRGLPRLHIPDSLSGLTVLDVGAWDGFYSFQAALRGAERVLATDSFAWDGSSWGSKEGFLLARSAFGLDERVRDQTIDVMHLSPEKIGGTYDVVLFLGVLYHLKSPLVALEKVAAVCGDLLILETETSLNFLRYPAARIYPGTELAEDPSNWFAFNISGLREMLNLLGFADIQVKWRTPLHRRIGRAVLAKRSSHAVLATLRSCRVVIHARRRSPETP